MKEFFMRLWRGVRDLVKRFATDRPNNQYEAAAFRAVREAAVVYSRRVIIV